jgi:hippurate hydrolase
LGTIRTFNLRTLEEVKASMIHIATTTAEAFGCKVEFEIKDNYIPTVNHKTETEHVVRLAEKYFGSVKTEGLPMTAAEDFSYYL